MISFNDDLLLPQIHPTGNADERNENGSDQRDVVAGQPK
jgi:hypothetical protein